VFVFDGNKVTGKYYLTDKDESLSDVTPLPFTGRRTIGDGFTNHFASKIAVGLPSSQTDIESRRLIIRDLETSPSEVLPQSIIDTHNRLKATLRSGNRL